MADAVLAIDIGTTTGFALLRADNRIEHGIEVFRPKGNEGPGGRYLRFQRWLAEIREKNPELKAIWYENVMFIGQDDAGNSHGSAAAQVYGGFLCVIQMFSETHNITCDGIAVMTIKKQFTGSGKAKKIDVMNQCKSMGFKVDSDNEADAIALLHVATGNAPLLTMTGASPGPSKRKPKPEVKEGEVPF